MRQQGDAGNCDDVCRSLPHPQAFPVHLDSRTAEPTLCSDPEPLSGQLTAGLCRRTSLLCSCHHILGNPNPRSGGTARHHCAKALMRSQLGRQVAGGDAPLSQGGLGSVGQTCIHTLALLLPWKCTSLL